MLAVAGPFISQCDGMLNFYVSYININVYGDFIQNFRGVFYYILKCT